MKFWLSKSSEVPLREQLATQVIFGIVSVDPNCLILRDARERSWQKGLRSSTFVITDALTATSLPDGCDTRVFHIIADSSIEELRLYVERFLGERTPAKD